MSRSRTAAAAAAAAVLAAAAVPIPRPAAAQEAQNPPAHPAGKVVFDTSLYSGLEYRMIGPYRGGRVTAVTGVPGSDGRTFYMGATGGGVWKTTNAGISWKNVSDGWFAVGSIGSIAVAPSDSQVVYVGTGSWAWRGNVSTGRGIYRSDDGGKSWRFLGLASTGSIGALAVDPRDPDRVFAAALGHPFGPSSERGVYRTEDGGRTWEKVLFISDSTGFADLSMDPSNPRVVYAAAWRAERKPWTMVDGAREGGIWKTTDGGDHWRRLSGGLPDGLLGKIGVAVSPVDPDRVYALVVAKDPDGGIWRSDDAGKSWSHVDSEHKLTQRGWYYARIIADPKDPNTVYAPNVRLWRSVDAGRKWERIRTRHGDDHSLWIQPSDPDVMIEGNDGGANITNDGGRTWSSLYNQPTAQLYRVFVDDRFPYRVYGPQQDLGTISVPAWAPGTGEVTPQGLWRTQGGGESGWIAFDPDHPAVTYAGSYMGVNDRMDHETGRGRNMIVYPQLSDGVAPKDLEYRFQWSAPIVKSRFDTSVVYHAAQYVLKTTDGGRTWTRISPDLTRGDTTKEEIPGGPVQHDHTGVEIYGTIFALAEGTRSADVLWAGSDDGLVHLTRDGGKTWTDVTPPGLPEFSTVNVIEPSPHEAGKAYVTAYRYRMDDWTPYVFETTDWGAHWSRIADGTRGIPARDPVRVVREDPGRAGLLYAGTEFGAFVSFDDGAHWQTLQQNLPPVPVTDLVVHGSDLVVATQGRSFWILDDVTPLRQVADSVATAGRFLFRPRPAYRADMGGFRGAGISGPPGPAVFDYYLSANVRDTLTLEILDADGNVVRTFRSGKTEGGEASEEESFFGGGRDRPLPSGKGMHRYTWNLRLKGVDKPEDAVVWGYTGGPTAVPGTYTARLSADDWSAERKFKIRPDPRWQGVSHQDLVDQLHMATAVRDTLQQVYDAIRALRSAREQVKAAAKRAGDAGAGGDVAARADSLIAHMTALEGELVQTRNESGQDPIRFPPRFDNQVAALYDNVAGPDGAPTGGARERWQDLVSQWKEFRGRLDGLLKDGVASFNQLLQQQDVPAVVVPKGGADGGGTGGS